MPNVSDLYDLNSAAMSQANMSRAKALCRSEPSERFIALTISFTGVLAFEQASRISLI
jgi:hypothetical protein